MSRPLVSVVAKGFVLLEFLDTYFPRVSEDFAKFIEMSAYFGTNYFTLCTKIYILVAQPEI